MLQTSNNLEQLIKLTQEFPATKLDALVNFFDYIYMAGIVTRQEFGSLLIRIEQRKSGELDVTQKLQQIAADIKEVLASQSWQIAMDFESCHPDLLSDLPDALHYICECQWKYSESVGVPYED